MQRRRRIKHTISLEERLAEEAKRLREEAKKLPPAPTREGLLRKAREDEMVAHLAERITSLVLAAPQISPRPPQSANLLRFRECRLTCLCCTPGCMTAPCTR
jgi:hypothetical protein